MDAAFDPHILPVYLRYNRLTARTLGHLLTDFGDIADTAAQAYGRQFAGLVHMPSLEIETAQTGDSIKFTLGEGWLPSISSDNNHDIVINTPRKLGIPLLVGYLMLSAAEKVLDIHSNILEDRIKQIELKLKQEELNKIMTLDHESAPQLLRQASGTLNTVFINQDITVFQLYDIDIINLRDKNRGKRHKE